MNNQRFLYELAKKGVEYNERPNMRFADFLEQHDFCPHDFKACCNEYTWSTTSHKECFDCIYEWLGKDVLDS